MSETKKADLQPPLPKADAIKDLKKVSIRGGLWVLALSILAIPLSYVRTWLLGQVGDDGLVLGTYAVVMIFFNVVTTFAILGGASVMTGLLPKQQTDTAKANLAASYAVLSIGMAAALLAAIFMVPPFTDLVFSNQDAHAQRIWFVGLGIAVVVSQLVIYILSGLMHFRLVAVLSQLQLLVVSAVAAVSVFLDPKILEQNAIPVLVVTIGLAHLIIALVGARSIARALPRPQSVVSYPKGFWRFSGFVHLNTLATFAYTNIDQLIVATWIGTRELGAYFALLQIAMLITFIPMRIGQVMLSSFSNLVGSGNYEDLGRAYQKLCRLILMLSTPIAFALILFSQSIAALFGDWLVEQHHYLILLAAAIYVGAIGSINAMLVLAHERSFLYAINSAVMISLQLGISLIFIEQYGVWSVIFGKAAAILSAQIGLFCIIRYGLKEVALLPPREYFVGVTIVGLATLFALTDTSNTIYLRLAVFVLFLIGFAITAKIRRADFEIATAIFSRKLSKRNK